MGVVTAFGNKTLDDEPVEEIVERLEGLLEQAKSGKIRGLAFAVTHANSKATGWNGDAGVADGICVAIMLLDRRYREYMAE